MPLLTHRSSRYKMVAVVLWAWLLPAMRAEPLAAQQYRAELHTQRGGGVIPLKAGEKRVLSQDRTMLLKVGPENSGASYLFMGSEDMPPGSRVPVHRHEVDEEILILHRGRLRVMLNDRTFTAEEGTVVFIPPKTWIGLENIGAATATVMFVFPRGGVEECFQYLGRGEDEDVRERTPDEKRRERMVCQMTYW